MSNTKDLLTNVAVSAAVSLALRQQKPSPAAVLPPSTVYSDPAAIPRTPGFYLYSGPEFTAAALGANAVLSSVAHLGQTVLHLIEMVAGFPTVPRVVTTPLLNSQGADPTVSVTSDYVTVTTAGPVTPPSGAERVSANSLRISRGSVDTNVTIPPTVGVGFAIFSPPFVLTVRAKGATAAVSAGMTALASVVTGTGADVTGNTLTVNGSSFNVPSISARVNLTVGQFVDFELTDNAMVSLALDADLTKSWTQGLVAFYVDGGLGYAEGSVGGKTPPDTTARVVRLTATSTGYELSGGGKSLTVTAATGSSMYLKFDGLRAGGRIKVV